MYFRFSLWHNPAKGKSDAYYRLIESYRNETNRVCHKTLLNVGFLDDLVNIDQLNQIRRILCNRREEALGNAHLFEIEDNNEQIVHDLTDSFWDRLVSEHRMTYNIIREIEYSIRTLKTDLDLRPIYHKKDDATMAHLHLGLLAYWVVNTVRYQLKRGEVKEPAKAKAKAAAEIEKVQNSDIHDIPINYNSQWKEIIRIMNTQKGLTSKTLCLE